MMHNRFFEARMRFSPAEKGSGRDENNIDALESLEDEAEDIESLEEVEEHTEYDEHNPNSDDGDDEMYIDAPVGKSLMDDVDVYLREAEQADEEDDE